MAFVDQLEAFKSERLAPTPEAQQVAQATVARLLEIAGASRASAATRLGTACFPGC